MGRQSRRWPMPASPLLARPFDASHDCSYRAVFPALVGALQIKSAAVTSFSPDDPSTTDNGRINGFGQLPADWRRRAPEFIGDAGQCHQPQQRSCLGQPERRRKPGRG